MDDPQQSLICHSSDNDKKEIHWDLDIRKCGAFHNYYASPGVYFINILWVAFCRKVVALQNWTLAVRNQLLPNFEKISKNILPLI